MNVRISVLASDEAASLESLADWLSGEPDLAGRFRLTGPDIRPGELGSMTDALVVAVGSGGVVSALASSLKAWLTHRKSDIRVRVEGPDGRKAIVEVDRGTVQDVETLIRAVLDSPTSE
ncbi:hypothetical protein J5X84_18995 [Streptosporangiaceae bacterium NEAU-GS5]|nr:hypothetical protein [Streptosporangiaceae bacterium NEAU-GS5]